MTTTITFRMPQGWSEYLGQLAHTHHFNSRGGMLGMALTECAYNTLAGKFRMKKGSIAPPTVVISCRIPIPVYEVIAMHCCKQIKDTPSVWAALAVAKWAEGLEKEDNKEQKKGMYWLYLRDYGQNYQAKVARLQHGLAQIRGVKQQ